MEFVKAMQISKRMCDKYSKKLCTGCPLSPEHNGTYKGCSCSTFIEKYPEQAEAILKKWDEENPVKTFLSDFLEKYPNAPLNDSKAPRCCPSDMGYCECCCNMNCFKCWNRPLESEEK